MAPEAINGATSGLAKGVTNGVKHGFSGKKKDLPQEALSIVQEKLPDMKAIGAVLELDIGLPQGPIWIDMRNNPCQVLEEFGGEPNSSVKVKPLYIKRFYEGAMDPRYGLFKDGQLSRTSLSLERPQY